MGNCNIIKVGERQTKHEIQTYADKQPYNTQAEKEEILTDST